MKRSKFSESQIVAILKQVEAGRKGMLWEARYKSVLVENGHATRVMAAYIDVNPVRAGMVNDAKDYRWCSY